MAYRSWCQEELRLGRCDEAKSSISRNHIFSLAVTRAAEEGAAFELRLYLLRGNIFLGGWTISEYQTKESNQLLPAAGPLPFLCFSHALCVNSWGFCFYSLTKLSLLLPSKSDPTPSPQLLDSQHTLNFPFCHFILCNNDNNYNR